VSRRATACWRPGSRAGGGDRLDPPGGYSLTIVSGICLAGLIIFYDARHKANPGAASHGVVPRARLRDAAFAVAGRLGRRRGRRARSALLPHRPDLRAKQESLARSEISGRSCSSRRRSCMGYGRSSAVASAPRSTGLLAWVGYAVWLLVRPGRANFPRAFVSFIAGISLLDGLLMAGAGSRTLRVGRGRFRPDPRSPALRAGNLAAADKAHLRHLARSFGAPSAARST